jgi:hypothetical protein
MSVTARRVPGGRSTGPVRALRIQVTVSIGIAVFPDHGVSAAAILGAADDALYAAKAAGRDTYRMALPLVLDEPVTGTSGHDSVLVVPTGGASGSPQPAPHPRGG